MNAAHHLLDANDDDLSCRYGVVDGVNRIFGLSLDAEGEKQAVHAFGLLGQSDAGDVIDKRHVVLQAFDGTALLTLSIVMCSSSVFISGT